jgi:hypothetical protein
MQSIWEAAFGLALGVEWKQNKMELHFGDEVKNPIRLTT